MADTTTSTYALTKPGVLDAAGAGLWGPKLNTDFDLIDGELAKPRIIYNSPTVGATTTCDLSLGRVFVFTVSQATTLAFSNVPSASFFTRIVLIVTNGSAFALSYPAAVSWLAGGAPTLQVSGVDLIELISIDAGTTWRARLLNGGYARIGAASNTGRVSQTIFQTQGLSTASTSEVSLATYSLPASALNINGRAIRITVTGVMTSGSGAGQIRVKFGSTYALNTGGTGNVTNNTAFRAECHVIRTGAATQRCLGTVLGGLAVTTNDEPAAAETLSGAVTVDIRGLAAAGGASLIVDYIGIEYLAT